MHANELFDKVTADLITAIENGASGWRMPWHCLANGTPRSADGRPYRGWTALVLAMVAADRGWIAGTWATYKTWAKHGCQVRRGERGTHVVLWKQTERPDPTDDDKTKRSLLARSFVVFAAEQVDGADRFTTTDERTPVERIEQADAYFATIGADIVHGGSHASYSPALDTIRLPHPDQFDRTTDYYSTGAHDPLTAPVGELGHPVGDPCDVIRWGSNGGGCGGIAGGTGNPRRVGSGCRACRSRSTLRWSAGCSSPRRCGRDGARSRRVLAELGSV